MNTDHFWTGIADVVSDAMSGDVKGAVYRVLTFAPNRSAFEIKVRSILGKSGDRLIVIEEPEVLTNFLEHEWVENDHEIFEMLETAAKNVEDVVCGEIEFYGDDDP